LVWDGITLRNGATVIPILVVSTDSSGRIASELVDVPISQGSRGPEVAALVHGVLEKVLCLSQKIVFRSASGLRVQGVASSSAQASSQGAAGQRRGNRSDLLTSMLVDRAYSGKTGNKADEHLCQMLGLTARLGLADKIHCCTGAADRAWSGKRSAAKEEAVAKSGAGGGGAKSSSAAGSAPTAMQESGSSSGCDSEGSSSESSSSSSQSSEGRAVRTVRIPLSVGPGFAGISGALGGTWMGYQASLQASPKTWLIEDQRVTTLRNSMSKWAHLCRSMSKFFSRGINRTLLAKAYRQHGIKACPRILAPLKVKMVVYCGQYLSQSMRHHAAGASAVLLAIRRLRRLKPHT